MRKLSVSFIIAALCSGVHAADPLAGCPGYKASNIQQSTFSIMADLELAGKACNVYGTDLDKLKLEVTHERADRIHVKIYDAANQVYQVPESVFPRPKADTNIGKSNLKFEFVNEPFSFRIARESTGEVLFDTSAASLVIESQYLRLRTKLPDNANLYGLGESTDRLKLGTDKYHRTLFNYDDGVQPGTNLYGTHPIYIDHRLSGSHGVFLLNSNGMDVKIDKQNNQQYLEYNTIGGIFDFYFLAGPSPTEVAKQYAQVAGLPALVPYAGLGFHNCRWGYRDAFELAEVVHNYSTAGIPLETMWADIDYMDGSSIFSLNPKKFPLSMMRDLVDHLHKNKQHFTVMVDPAVAARDYPPYHRGQKDGIFLQFNGSEYNGVVWPGKTAYPDWFAEDTVDYWSNEFDIFFSTSDGVDIDFLWIDMNEPSNFCVFPCNNPKGFAQEMTLLGDGGGPAREPPRPLPGFPCDFQPKGTDCKRQEPSSTISKQKPLAQRTKPERNQKKKNQNDNDDDNNGMHKGLPGRDLLYPKYKIQNKGGDISTKTVRTDVLHKNNLTMYDTHNLYGTMMSSTSRTAMLNRRPGKRPMVITRSTFAGAGAHVGHWLGDNASEWPDYRFSISGMLTFNSIFQVPMVGSDVCGFGNNANEELCARWAMLGAFQPFYRNHNSIGSTPQEFYRWKVVTEAAKKAIDIRYRMLDYFYTALYEQSATGSPALSPMFYLYPRDINTFALDLQYFYGPALLVAPVTAQGATSVEVYLPKAVFYDFYTHQKIQGEGKTITISNQTLTDIPLFLRGGIIVPLRMKSAMTTFTVREQDFELLIPVDEHGTAKGTLYLDDGETINQEGKTTYISFEYKDGKLKGYGDFNYKTNCKIAKLTVIGLHGGGRGQSVNQPLTGPFEIMI